MLKMESIANERDIDHRHKPSKEHTQKVIYIELIEKMYMVLLFILIIEHNQTSNQS